MRRPPFGPIRGHFPDSFIRYLQKYWGLSEEPERFEPLIMEQVEPKPFPKPNTKVLFMSIADEIRKEEE